LVRVTLPLYVIYIIPPTYIVRLFVKYAASLPALFLHFGHVLRTVRAVRP
jgi:hypothetical protein